jgi:sterol desaturase/sphingolipid hydroxylase (fatty acid hydroxylase superfamily)
MIPFVLVFIFGAFSWTFLEYVLHRWFHVARGKNHPSREHLKHHATPSYFSPALQKAAMVSVMVPIAGLTAYFVFGVSLALTFATGLGAAYLAYEWLHYHAHVAAPSTGYGSRVRARHFHHHFVAPTMNHGVTTGLWDHVFRTHVPPTAIPVPKKHVHALAWVLGGGDDIDPRFKDVYRLV